MTNTQEEQQKVESVGNKIDLDQERFEFSKLIGLLSMKLKQNQDQDNTNNKENLQVISPTNVSNAYTRCELKHGSSSGAKRGLPL
jgi:hypothetical protein